MQRKIKIIECPRDAMQGIKPFIPTAKKINYLNELLKVGFNTIDAVSFVSPKNMPQMADAADVLNGLNVSNSPTNLLAIIANERGALQAVEFNQIKFIGFPFSISETFQLRNTNSTLQESFQRLEIIQNLCIKKNKQLVVYISMAFGNPYGDRYDEENTLLWIDKIVALGIQIISLADTVGLATPEQVFNLTKQLINNKPEIETGVHLHSTSQNRYQKLEAALNAGCLRFDGAINGFGGCPMAGNVLVGNLDTLWMIDFFSKKNISLNLNQAALLNCTQLSNEIFIH